MNESNMRSVRCAANVCPVDLDNKKKPAPLVCGAGALIFAEQINNL